MKCFICYKTVLNLTHLQSHVRLKHDSNSFTKFTCSQDKCLRTYTSLQSLYKHIRNTHMTIPSRKCSNSLSTELEQIIANVNDDVIEPSDLDDCASSHQDTTVESESSLLLHSLTPLNQNSKSFDLSNSHVQNAELSFILKLYNRLNLTRKDVQGIVEDTKCLIETVFPTVQNSFAGLSSEHLIKSTLIHKKLFSESETLALSFSHDQVAKVGEACELRAKPITAQYNSLPNVVQHVFENSNLLGVARSYMKSENDSSALFDIKDCKDYYCLRENEFPYVIFFDEVECGNPLGSHKGVQKIGALYLSFKCFPTHLNSCLKNIFIVSLFPSGSNQHLQSVLERLRQDIVTLNQNGIVLMDQLYYFKFCGFLGDNLGLHQILGFSQSFVAIYWCRKCKMHREEARVSTRDEPNLYRNPLNYESDLCDDFSQTGISFESTLNTIPDFHVSQNGFVDAMHDIFEGVANIGMAAIIQFYVSTKVFDLITLNRLIRQFPFFEISNKPPVISLSHLDKGELAFSAAECKNLVLYFGLIVGDRINEDCEVWLYYRTLREIVDIVLMKSVTVDHSKYLAELIHQHHTLYKSLFRKHLRPKFHFLTHYPSYLLQSGPICHN